ncbi:hypothetical protein [Halorhabdus sp. CUG00001]|uniref:hypothetical protein n=1 Tax=Halorhabdus sp. CUG00001 TaxID=2600297 RepID=UPI00131B32B7|nr:hypothetical protein [Halorhabdus sp. CUG00001]
MSLSRGSLVSSARAWNQGGRLYVAVGLATAILSLVLVPSLGLIAVYCGYKLYTTQRRTALALLVSGLGGFGFLWWVVYLSTL